MTTDFYIENQLNSKPDVILGPRLEADVRRRIRELEARFRGALTRPEKSELQRLRDLLRAGGRS